MKLYLISYDYQGLQFCIDYTLGTILLYRYEENNFLKIFIVAS